jgi:hypothetical protein
MDMVEHYGGTHRTLFQGQLAGHADQLRAVLAQRQEDLDEGAVAFGLLEQLVLHRGDRCRQRPRHERRAMAQCPGLALEQRQVVPGVEHQARAGEAARMDGDLFTVGHDDDPLGTGAQRDPLSGVLGRNAVAVAIVGDGAGGADSAGLLEVAVEGPRNGTQIRLRLGEDGADRAC